MNSVHASLLLSHFPLASTSPPRTIPTSPVSPQHPQHPPQRPISKRLFPPLFHHHAQHRHSHHKDAHLAAPHAAPPAPLPAHPPRRLDAQPERIQAVGAGARRVEHERPQAAEGAAEEPAAGGEDSAWEELLEEANGAPARGDGGADEEREAGDAGGKGARFAAGVGEKAGVAGEGEEREEEREEFEEGWEGGEEVVQGDGEAGGRGRV